MGYYLVMTLGWYLYALHVYEYIRKYIEHVFGIKDYAYTDTDHT